MHNALSLQEVRIEPRVADRNLAEIFVRQNGLVFEHGLLPPDLIEELYGEACALEPQAQRKHLPFFKKGASVSCFQMAGVAPRILGLYRSPLFRSLIESITGETLEVCPDRDAHACALYYYTEPGDHIGFHYDTSHYRGSRFTVLIGLYDRSDARLVCRVGSDPNDASSELHLATNPGMCVIFDGNKLYHRVSPIGAEQRRVVLSLEYVTDTGMSRWGRLVSRLKDSIAYFGFRQMFSRRRRRAGERV